MEGGHNDESEGFLPGHVPVHKRNKKSDWYEQSDVSDRLTAADNPSLDPQQIRHDGLEGHEVGSMTSFVPAKFKISEPTLIGGMSLNTITLIRMAQ